MTRTRITLWTLTLTILVAALTVANHADAATPKQQAITAIRQTFGRYAGQAIRVAYCETGGTFSVTARNGDYLGLFQFGSYARNTYGFGWTAIAQTRAAWRYFKASGYRWTAWSCKP